MRKILLSFLLVFFLTLPLFAQTVDTAWVRRYGGPPPSGSWAYAIAVDGSGNVYVTGVTYESGTSYDYLTIKYYPNGDTAWVRRYNGPESGGDVAYAIAVDGSGNVYVTGTSSNDYATIKYHSNGDTAWVRRYNGPGNGVDDASAIAVDGSGNVYVTGTSSDDYATIKYYSNGDTVWLRRYNGQANGSDRANAIAVDGSGNIYVTGTTYNVGTGLDFGTIKYDSDGNQIWVRTYNGPENTDDLVRGIATDGSGNVYVTGFSPFEGGPTSSDYLTVKYYPNGDTAWVRRYNGPSNSDDHTAALATDTFDNVYVTGYSQGSGTFSDYATIKYYPNGDTAWVRRYNGPRNATDAARAIAVDGSGNVYVTGYSYGSGTDYDFATIKYNTNGNIAWIRRYSGPGNSIDEATGIAVDGCGNVYVAGLSGRDDTQHDFATLKYWQNYPPDSFSLVSPYDSTVHSYAVAFNWQTAADPDPWDTTKYDLYVSTSPAFYPDSTFIYHSLLSNQHINTLEIGRYYWKVRAYDKRSETWANQIWTFRVQNYPPNVFSLLSPSDSAMIPYIINFDWETAIDPDPWDTAKYDLYLSTSSIFNPDSTVIYDSLLSSRYTDTLGLGRYFWKVRAYDTRLQTWSSQTWTLLSAKRGDANADKKVTIADVVYLVNFLFKSGPATNPFQVGDVNCDGYVTVSDVVYLINYLFKGGPPPAC